MIINPWYYIAKSFIWKDVCDLPAKSLICQTPNHLTAHTNQHEIGNLYYIKGRLVHSITQYYYNERKATNEKYIKHTIIPKEYFNFAKELNLKLDKESYFEIIEKWMDKNERTNFYSKIKQQYLPDKGEIPSEWGSIEKIEDDITKRRIKLASQHARQTESAAYADLFQICGFGCLITGNGKTHACRLIADQELVLDNVILKRANEKIYGKSGVFGGSEDNTQINYCIHMLSDIQTKTTEIDRIVEITFMKYLYYAEGNILNVSDIGSYYNVMNNSYIKYILVPYCSTMEIRAQLMHDYFEKEISNPT